MKDQNQTSAINETTSEQIVQPERKRSNKTQIIIATVLILSLLGLSAGYFLFAQKKSNKQNNPPTSQAPTISTPVSPTSTANTPTKVATFPLKANEFVKDVVSVDSCNNPIGLVSYHDTKNGTWMRINSLLDSQNNYSETGLSQIEAYLNGNTILQPNQNINGWEFSFRNYCGGSSHIFMKELPGVFFPNTENAKAMMVNTTQEAWAHVTVVVLAKKGNDIIQLSKYMDESLYEPFYKGCSFDSDDVKSANCFNAKLMQDKNFENEAINQANALISEFAIK